MKRRVILMAGVAGALALLIAVVGAAGAFAWGGVSQGGPAASLTPSAATAAYPTTGNGAGFCGGYGNGAGINGSVGNNLLQAAAEVLGVNAQDVQNGIQAGQSIAQQAKAKGIDTAKIIDAFKTIEQQQLNGYVASGNLTQQQADAMLNMHVGMAQLIIDNNYSGNGFGGYGMMGGNGYGMMGGYGNGLPSGGNGNRNPTTYGPGMMGGYWN
jgi:hypothetical protein